MDTKVSIMGTDVTIVSTDTFLEQINEYLTNDYMNVLFFLSAPMLELAVQSPEYQAILAQADMLLPGIETMLTLHHVDILQTGGMVVNYKCLDLVFKDLSKKNKSVYIVCRSEEELKRLIVLGNRCYEGVAVTGISTKDLEQNTEIIVNEINSIAPDVLIFAEDSPIQENWIIANSSILNAKLCISIGSILNSIFEEMKETPVLFRKIGLSSFYQSVRQNVRLKKLTEARIFRRKFEHYKNKKGEIIDGNKHK